MVISPYIARIREHIGTGLLLVPTVAVIPWDAGRILLVRHAETGKWATVGGTIEPDESPEDAACREAEEEAGVTVRLGRLLTALGGPQYRTTYPNGDRVSCVPIVFGATVVSGTPRPDGEETSEVGWFRPDQLTELDLDRLNGHLLSAALPLLTP